MVLGWVIARLYRPLPAYERIERARYSPSPADARMNSQVRPARDARTFADVRLHAVREVSNLATFAGASLRRRQLMSSPRPSEPPFPWPKPYSDVMTWRRSSFCVWSRRSGDRAAFRTADRLAGLGGLPTM